MLELRWCAHQDDERIAQTRLLSYAPAPGELPAYLDALRTDPRAGDGDYLLALDGPDAVGTATSMSLTMWVRGAAVPCQGVAYVGTIHTRRRTRRPGVATQLMHETLRMGRERQQVLSALMPFRASFYQHFGYAVVERRHEWTIPMDLLPGGDFSSLRFARAGDAQGIHACYQRFVERGQCGVARSAQRWTHIAQAVKFFEVVDADENVALRGYLAYTLGNEDARPVVRVHTLAYDDAPALLRQLHFLGGLRDQCTAAVLTLPADVPLERLLREPQIPHRPVSHAVAALRPYTRMQARVLDHQRLLEAMRLPPGPRARLVVAVHECEGHVQKFALDIADGRAQASPSAAAADVQCPDHVWAAVALGELPATTARAMGLISCDTQAAAALDILSHGPRPSCDEFF